MEITAEAVETAAQLGAIAKGVEIATKAAEAADTTAQLRAIADGVGVAPEVADTTAQLGAGVGAPTQLEATTEGADATKMAAAAPRVAAAAPKVVIGTVDTFTDGAECGFLEIKAETTASPPLAFIALPPMLACAAASAPCTDYDAARAHNNRAFEATLEPLSHH